MILQPEAMQSAALATPSSPHVTPGLGPPSRERKGAPGAKQSIVKALPKARKRPGLGFMAKGVDAAKSRAAAGSRGQQQTPDGAGQAPAAPAAKSGPSIKAALGEAAAISRSSRGQVSAGGAVGAQEGQAQQQAQVRGEKSMPWLVSPHLAQFVPGRIIAPTPGYLLCKHLGLPGSIMQSWYPDLQPGSSLHLQIKVPPAAATAQNAPQCGPQSQAVPEQGHMVDVAPSQAAETSASPTSALEPGVECIMKNKQVLE